MGWFDQIANMGPNDWLMMLIGFLLIIPAIILHELAHGWVSYKLGDPTAKRAGRLTLNPFKHIDPFGTIIMPALLFFGSGGRFAFGSAKPVPINPNYYKNRRRGILLTGLAGPVTNVLLALVVGLILRGVMALIGMNPVSTIVYVLILVIYRFVYINLMLAFFNLIPIPPLDGSRVLQRFLPRAALHYYNLLERWGFVIVLAFLIFVPQALNAYFNVTVNPLLRLITGIGGLY